MFTKKRTTPPKAAFFTDESEDSPTSDSSGETSAENVKPWAPLLYDPPTQGEGETVLEDYLPQENLVSSYAYQWYRFQLMGQHYAIRPTNEYFQPFNHLWPELPPQTMLPFNLDDVAIIGYCHPHGTPSAITERQELRERAVDIIRVMGYQAFDVVAINQKSRWLEPMLLVPEMPADIATQVGAELGQFFITRLTYTYHSVHEVNGRERGGAYTWDLLEMGLAPCPMNLGYEIYSSPKRAGGPWVSRSMEVAGQWQVHFRDSHSLLACQPCQTRTADKGRALLRGTWIPASRYKYMHADPSFLGDENVLRRLEPVTIYPAADDSTE